MVQISPKLASMNGGPEFRNALVEAGFLAARAEAVIRYLGESGLVPRGGRGRHPKSDLAWGAWHYAAAIIGLGAILPIDAPSLVESLAEVKQTSSVLHTGDRDENGEMEILQLMPERVTDVSLGVALATQIHLLAEQTSDARQALRQAMKEKNLFIRLDAGSLTALLPFLISDKTWGSDQYGPPSRDPLAPERPRLSARIEMKMEIEIVFIAADLLAETMAKQGGSGPPPEGGALAGAPPEGPTSASQNDEAPDLAGSGASALTNQPPTSDRALLNTPENREIGTFQQSLSLMRGWPFPYD
ncbi:hypothetical protein [Teichococcus oryzae]|uniref:Uncharacterized protein n=1 Tax=Teichococcus oryzae TaxID=1608942 RepID=A0A5B2TA17_9PROT|nr:hypothetical protein [Pseudoroseomonas oryzae]KAA2211421.1 hypothetical protein F0Q34_20185 [Pseudoroseomonas oryzae]